MSDRHFNFLFLALKKKNKPKLSRRFFITTFINWVDQGQAIYVEQREDNISKKRSACSPKAAGCSTCSEFPKLNKVKLNIIN